MSAFWVKKALVRVYDNKQELGRAAAAEAAVEVQEAIRTRGRARIVVGTGNSQDELVDALVKESDLDWSRVECFHLDEYVGIPDSHPASFRRWLRTRLVDRVSSVTVHYLRGETADPEEECRRYGELLQTAGLDLAFVGFGENGHIAFNDPHEADFSDTHIVKRVRLDEPCRRQQVGEGHFSSLEVVPREALTLTCPTLMGAASLICCVPDRRKAEAVRGALEGPLSPSCPASLVLTHPRATVYLDRESASLLRRSEGPSA